MTSARRSEDAGEPSRIDLDGVLSIRLGNEHREVLRQAAKVAGLRPSVFARQATLAAARRLLAESGASFTPRVIR